MLKVAEQSILCLLLLIDAAPVLAFQTPIDTKWAEHIVGTPLQATATKLPNSDATCDSLTKGTCGVVITTTITNGKGKPIDEFRLRCKNYDGLSHVVNNEAAEPFGSLPLDAGDTSEYKFFLSKILWSQTNTLKCYVSYKIGQEWFDPKEGATTSSPF